MRMVRAMIRAEMAKTIYADTFHTVSPEDSERWMDLFMLADMIDPEFAAILQYLRNTGTKLVKDKKWGYRLVPHIGVDGWQTADEYKRESKYLLPYKNQLAIALKKLK